ncbi:Mom family adenine methylcarbamoylation protein [Nonomuraea turcica]|uniref:Mom family adenine methylcarbamoylation protein n=1 Tax=Nonomuraea sp. G32 TaxID=3067274 RepID=UPI00273C6496|nr:hypothetical protein [Nonomuraea sp. G32]MDP4510319.1 hypothetical protein [Nonomuraea sp. G32]
MTRYVQQVLELTPFSTERGQRWRDRAFSWQLQRCVFEADRYSVELIDRKPAKEFVVRHHYSGSWPAVIHQMGMFDHAEPGQPRLVGVAALSYPTSNASLTNAFPGLEVGAQSLVLGRFVLLDDVPLNGESGRCCAACNNLSSRSDLNESRGRQSKSRPIAEEAA